MYDVTIKVALNGYLVRVGCQRLVFSSKEELLTELNNYLSFPNETEQRLRERSINSAILGYSDNTTRCVPEPYTAVNTETEDRDAD